MEWISVKDRLPENEQEVIVISHGMVRAELCTYLPDTTAA